STVTCLRSPWRASFDSWIRSARCLGVYCWGEAKRGIDARPSAAPPSPQNFFSGGLLAPHAEQAAVSRAPHSPQNFCAGGFSCWQRRQFIPKLSKAIESVVYVNVRFRAIRSAR